MSDSLFDFAINAGAGALSSSPQGQGAAPGGDDSRVSSFVQQYLPVAQRVAKSIGVDPQVLLGQWGLETGWGKSVIPGTNNLGNIKDQSGAGAQATDNQTGSRDAYRNYANADVFGDDYAKLIQRRYGSAVGSGSNADRFFSELKRGGYAEDPAYVQKGVSAAGAVARAMGASPAAGAPTTGERTFYTPVNSGMVSAAAPQPGATAGDFFKELAASAIDSVGSIGEAIGEVGAGVANKVGGTEDYHGINPLKSASGAVRDTMTEGGKQARADADIQGDIADPSTWRLPSTAQGLAMVAANGFGSLAGMLIPIAGPAGRVAMLTKAAKAAELAGDAAKAAELAQAAKSASTLSRVAGAGAEGAMTGGSAADEVRGNVQQTIGQMTHDQLMQSVPVYAETYNATGDEQQARKAVVNGAARWAGALSAVAGAAGGAFNSKVLEDMLLHKGMSAMIGGSTASRVGRTALGSAGGAAVEGGQELSEKVGQNAGENIGLGRDATDNVTRNSLGDFVGGALVGGGIGAGAGVTSHHPSTAATPAAPAPQPNSPLSNAANAGTAAAQATAAPQPQADPIAEKVATIKDQVHNGHLLEALRAGDSPVDVKTFVSDLAIAGSPSSDPRQREMAMGRLEFAMSWAGQHAPTIDAASTTAPQRQAGVDREAELLAQKNQAATPSAAAQIDGELAANRAANLGAPTVTPAPQAQPAMELTQHTPDEPTTSPGAAPDAAPQPAGAIEPDATLQPGNPAFNTDGLSLVPKADPQQEAQQAAQQRASEANDQRMAAHESEQLERSADADVAARQQAADAAARAEQRPHADAVIAALKLEPFQRTADQKAALARAGATYSGAEMALMQKAAQSPFAMSATEKTQLNELRNGRPVSPVESTPAGQAPAFIRKRRAHLDQMAELGFDTVERTSDGFVMRNSMSGQSFRLDGIADAQLARAAIKARIDRAASRANTEPTEAQKEAGNYRKGERFQLNGFNITIENPEGSTRRGTSPDGKAWESKIVHHYGDLNGVLGADGDKMDVFIGPRPDSTKIFVVDQRNADGSFDEHKVMMGFTSEEAARRGYLANYEPGWNGLMAITEMTPEQFKAWAKSDAAKLPAYQSVGSSITVRDNGIAKTVPLLSEEYLANKSRPGVTKKQVDLLRKAAAVFGKRIEFYVASGDLPEGFLRIGDASTIYLAVNSKVSALSIFGHELMHMLRREAPQAYDAVASVVQSRVKDAQGFLRYYGDENLSPEDMLEELVSDLNGELMRDETFWREVFQEIADTHGDGAKGLIAQLAEFIGRLVDQLVAAFKGEPGFESKHFVEDVEAMRGAFRAALAQYGKDVGISKAAMQAEVLRAKQATAKGATDVATSPARSEPSAEPDDVQASKARKEAAPSVEDLTPVAQRGERVLGKQLRLSDDEKQAIEFSAETVGISTREITAVVREHKLAHPTSQGWAPLTFLKAKVQDGKVSYQYQVIPYDFNASKDGKALKPDTPEYKRRVQAVGRAMTDEVRRVYERAESGDKNAQNILSQAGWYKAMRARLRHEFGGLGDLFADLLGATSPNTPVRDNWSNAVDSLRRASRGDFDALIPAWESWANGIDERETELRGWFNEQIEAGHSKKEIKAMPEYEQKLEALAEARKLPDSLLPTKETGKKYGFNGRNVARAMVDLWRVVRNADPDVGRGGTAPKALNFSGNLIGFRERATIDVWAARMLQRLAGGLRIPSMAESGVSGEMRSDGSTTLQFGFGQDVFSDAVKRIRSDAAMKLNDTLAKINDDDLQAVVWFVEKELWTVNDWTSAAGEGGSFELEANLAGPADQDKIRTLRRTVDSSKSTPAEKALARRELAALERTVDRFTGGLSIQMSAGTQGEDFVPQDADMARLSNEIRTAIYEDETSAAVLASKALSTEGRYGEPERSLDLEVVAREGYDPTALWRKMLETARDAKQDSTYLSRVLRDDEDVDPLLHRPGVEIYFREAASREKLEALLASLAKEGVEYLTVIVDGRRMAQATSGAMPPAVGVRMQYVPEFEQRYGGEDFSGLTNNQLADKLKAKASEMAALAERVSSEIDGVSFASQFWYETNVAFSHEYEEKINAIAAGAAEGAAEGVRGQKWIGQPVRAGLESADRQAGKADVGEPGAADEAVGGDAAGAEEGLKASRARGGFVAPDTPAFKRWFGDSKVVDDKAKPLVVYHGTTNEFHAFDRSRSNVESDMGAGFYFSNTPEDVAANYAGEGPDLTARIELLAERIISEAEDVGEDLTMDQAKERARAKLSEGKPNVMPVYLSVQNPLVLGGHEETYLDYSEPYNDELDEYDEPAGKLVDVIMALRQVLHNDRWGDTDVEKAVDSVLVDAGAAEGGGISASKLIDALKSSEGLQYATDEESENGALASTEIIRQALQGAGFDGVIDRTVDSKFGSGSGGKPMRGMHSGTVHYIAFEPEQIKSAVGNRGTFDQNESDITKSRARDPQTLTPQFKAWFGESKVTDADGAPQRVYTGTSKDVDFKSFKVPKNGVWFTTDHAVASDYAKENDSQGSPYNPDTRRYEPVNTASRVIPAYLRIEKPYTLSEAEAERMRLASNYKVEQGRIFNMARAKGYDGVDLGGGTWVVLKSPDQIKSSVGNGGGFDPTKGDITKSTRRHELAWRERIDTADGPVFGAKNFALVKPTKLAVDDFAEDDKVAMPMGHASYVTEGNTPYGWQIVDTNGKPLGILQAQVTPDGEIEAIHDIAIDGQKNGVGRDVVTHIAANRNGDVRVIEAIPQSQGFWDKMGAGYYDANRNATLDWSTLSRGAEGQAAEEAGQQAADAGGAVPAGEAAELSADDAEALGFKLSRARAGSPEFESWFGDSKVVNNDGSPKVVYHGTDKSFDAFSSSKSSPEFWFTDDPEVASAYATRYARKDGGNVVPAYLASSNPLVVDAHGSVAARLDNATYPPEFKSDRKVMSSDTVTLLAADQGYDGVIFNNMVDGAGKPSTVYTVFRPEQIKSAIGNGGTFSALSTDITKSAAREGWQTPSASKFDDLVYKMQDKHVDTKRVVDAIKETDGAIRDDLDVYLQEELFHGRAAKRTEEFVHTELEPLVEAMRERRLTIEEFDEFLHARHAREANAVIAQRNPQLQDGGSGMLNQDAEAYFSELPADKRAAFEAAAAHVDGILRKTNELLVDYELESAETVHGWTEMFQHYVPLMREDEGRHSGNGTGQGFSIKGREVKSRTGSTRKVVDILANIAMQRERTIVRGEKNRVARALLGLAQANPNQDFWHVDSVPKSQVFNKDTGLVEERPDNLFKQRENVLVAKVAHPGGIHEHAVIFNEKDERALRMASALKNLDAAQLEGLLGASAKATRYFASVNTQYNPVFGVVNLIRDVQESMVNLQSTELAGKQATVARYTMGALRGIYGDLRKARKGQEATTEWGKLWEEFQHVGGQTGYRQLFVNSADRAKAIERALNPSAWMDSKLAKIFTANGALKVPLAVAQKAVRWIFDWLSDYNEAMENGVRLASYRAALEHGMSKERAASLAKNLTVNFNRKGQVAQQAGALYAFFNASMQGTARVGKTLFTMEPGKPKTIRLSPLGKKIVFGGMLLGTTQALALAAAGFRDDDPPEFARNNSLIIPTGARTYVTIAMPMGLRIIPAIGRITTEWALGGFKQPTKRALSLVGLFADSFNPIGNAGMSMQTIAPTVFDPLVALTENKDFAGRPIAKESKNKAIPGSELGRDTSTTVGQLLSEAINYLSGGTKHTAGVLSPTPDQIDYLIGQVTGGVGRELSHVEQTALGVARGEDVPVYKVPLAGRFFGNAASQASEGTNFYANVDKLNELETEIKGLRHDGDAKGADAVRKANPESYLITVANHAELAVQKLRKQKSDLVKAGASREDVKAIEAKITARMAALNRAMEALQK